MKTNGAELSAGATSFLFEPPPQPGVPVKGESALYPVHRIFGVGRNYVEHAKEMGVEPEREAPWYFTKPSTAIVLSGGTVPYPPGTQNYHYEMELVVAIGAPAYFAETDQALSAVFGYATGLDMTRRDLQMAERAKSRPWDIGKSFEQSAVIAPITKLDQFGDIGPQRITLAVNGENKQNALLSQMIWSVPEIISHLSRYYHLGPGDLIYSGTPAGVGPVKPGDRLTGKIDGLAPVDLTIAESDRIA
jgi:fumarylpyruvate hydrolase